MAADLHDPSDDSDGSSSSSSSSPSVPQVQTLVAGREKRSTAGTRLTELLEQAEQDEEAYAGIFAEDESEDAEFQSADDANGDDEQLDSSSDEEGGGAPKSSRTAGTTQNDDDDEGYSGEAQLQAEARQAKQALKRKRAHLPSAMRKRVRLDPTLSPSAQAQSLTSSPAPKPSKKKKPERVSWLPSSPLDPSGEGNPNIRSSQRTLSVLNKAAVKARVLSSEAQRAKTLERMRIAEAANQGGGRKPKRPLTQAEHLAQAAAVELLNRKSLNRWQEAEEAREAEQARKLAALHDRRFTGPVLQWYSGMGTWEDGVLKRVGRIEVEYRPPVVNGVDEAGREEKVKRPRGRPKHIRGESGAATTLAPAGQLDRLRIASPSPSVDSVAGSQASEVPSNNSAGDSTAQQSRESTGPPPDQVIIAISNVLPSPSTSQAPSQLQSQHPSQPASGRLQEISRDPSPVADQVRPASTSLPTPDPSAGPFTLPLSNPDSLVQPPDDPLTGPSSEPQPTPCQPLTEFSTRNLLILQNFPGLSSSSSNPSTSVSTSNTPSASTPTSTVAAPTLQSTLSTRAKLRRALFPSPSTSTGNNTNNIAEPAVSAQPHKQCPITAQRARYRDPGTGIAYRDLAAFREVRRLVAEAGAGVEALGKDGDGVKNVKGGGQARWSNLLGCFVGVDGEAAVGVPAGFLAV